MTCHCLIFAIAISCQTSDVFIARSRQNSIERRMHLLLLFSQSSGSEVNVSHNNTIRNNNQLLPTYYIMLRKTLVTRMSISLHHSYHDMCLVEQRLGLSQNSPFPVFPVLPCFFFLLQPSVCFVRKQKILSLEKKYYYLWYNYSTSNSIQTFKLLCLKYFIFRGWSIN